MGTKTVASPQSSAKSSSAKTPPGTYDNTNLPDELIMSSYFSISDDKIVSLTVIVNQPSPY